MINGVTAIDNVSSQVPTAAAASGDTPESERNLFMTLLVAQLKNQDPLSPQDGTAFVAQLAQFNSLDQLVGIRAAIDKLNTLLAQTKTPASVPAASEN